MDHFDDRMGGDLETGRGICRRLLMDMVSLAFREDRVRLSSL